VGGNSVLIKYHGGLLPPLGSREFAFVSAVCAVFVVVDAPNVDAPNVE
jgi:hypothetical protein